MTATAENARAPAWRLAHACPLCNGCVNLEAGTCDRCGVELPGVSQSFVFPVETRNELPLEGVA